MSKGVSTLTFDDEYLKKRQVRRREKAEHVGEGIAMGAQELGTGIASGASCVRVCVCVVWYVCR